ncbi:hypothetical protein H2201_000716 [Coniosporium apollinis]|uniref:Protein kinase domain-containing protein n=1 Tax=Coniosporium apollinis TaxID=61459 RepID=A0ABQ9P6Z7_9PEZI|nr:hypothetical protein H2201_000716 [Coniosporium apollinis]
MASHGYGRPARQPSTRHVRRDSPLSVLGQSHGFSANAPMMQRIDIGDSSDDEMPQPMKLSAYTEGLLAANKLNSPERVQRQPKLRISRNTSSQSNTPKPDVTPAAPSIRVKRVPLRGAPVRFRRTPDSQQDQPSSQEQENMYGTVSKPTSASRDQENIYGTVSKPPPVSRDHHDLSGSTMKPAPESSIIPEPASLMKADLPVRPSLQRSEKPIPLAPISANTPRRPAPPPPPKMSVLSTATTAAGASTTKKKAGRGRVRVNGIEYSQMGKIGKGGSSDVYRVMAESGKMFALKRVALEDADEAAVRGYKGEIELLRKLENVERVVRLFDYEVNEEKQVLYVLMDMGESDLAKLLKTKLDPDLSTTSPRLDLPFTRYYWKEMLECVSAVHAHDIVHSDLKPANFLLVSGRLQLIDFGIANAIDVENTVNVHRDSHVGTPNYMSPESLSDTNASARAQPGGGAEKLGKMMKLGKKSDVWSLGCILYQMVYGRPPFAHIANQLTRVMAIVNPAVSIEFPTHGVGGVRVPPELLFTLKGCLQRDPAKRPGVEDLLSERNGWLYPECDLRISQPILENVINRVVERFRDEQRKPPSDDEIKSYASSFYVKIREMIEDGRA